jgi:putative oxidoreductase
MAAAATSAVAASRDLALLLLRLAGVLLAVNHGWGKVMRLASGEGERFITGVGEMGFPVPAVFAWAAALSEFAGGLLVGVGLLARPAALFAGFTMFAAAFLRHKAHLHILAAVHLVSITPEQLEDWGDPESALIYLFVFVAVLVFGPGRLSIDFLRGRRARGA